MSVQYTWMSNDNRHENCADKSISTSENFWEKKSC